MSNFKIVTVATHRPTAWYYTFDEFFKSCGEHQPLVLTPAFYPYTGLGSKIKMVYKAIKEGLIDTKYILFCDCFDMFFATNPQELINKYEKLYGGHIIFSSEKNCFPADLKNEYDKLPYTSSYRYLNSGMIVGETDMFLRLLESMDIDNIPDDYRKENGDMVHINDQYLYQQIFLKSPVPVKLDYNQDLCQTLHQVSFDEFYQYGSCSANPKNSLLVNYISNKETKSTPCLYHANGSAKDSGVKEPIMKILNLI